MEKPISDAAERIFLVATDPESTAARIAACTTPACIAGVTSSCTDSSTESKDNSCANRLPPNNGAPIKGLGTRDKSTGIIRITI